MKILVLGGTTFFGVHMVNEFIASGDDVYIATRGLTPDQFNNKVKRIKLDRKDEVSVKNALQEMHFDIICDNTCYSPNELKYVLDNVTCDRYIFTSTGAVYDTPSMGIVEEEFNPLNKEIVWCNDKEYSYGQLKQYIEIVLCNHYSQIDSVCIRYPFVIGVDDYTKRLYAYVNAIVNEKTIYIDNIDSTQPFVRASDAGKFIAYMAKHTYTGAVNGSNGVMSLQEIIAYVERKCGNKAIYADASTFEIKGGYNTSSTKSLCTQKAEDLGYTFTPIQEWIYELLDELIEEAKNNR